MAVAVESTVASVHDTKPPVCAVCLEEGTATDPCSICKCTTLVHAPCGHRLFDTVPAHCTACAVCTQPYQTRRIVAPRKVHRSCTHVRHTLLPRWRASSPSRSPHCMRSTHPMTTGGTSSPLPSPSCSLGMFASRWQQHWRTNRQCCWCQCVRVYRTAIDLPRVSSTRGRSIACDSHRRVSRPLVSMRRSHGRQ